MEQLDLSDFFQTKAQANTFFAGLEKLSGKIYTTDFNLEKAFADEFGVIKKDLFMRMIVENEFDIQSNAALKALLEKLMDKIAKLPVLSMTIAVQPSEYIMRTLSEWMVLTLRKQILFDITVDPTLIAGATVSFRGKYMDCSIKPVFDRVLKKVLSGEKKAPTVTMHQSIEHITFGR